MKKLLVVLCLLLVIAVPVMASSLSTEVLPGLEAGLIGAEAGFYYNVPTDQIYNGVQTPIIDYKDCLNLGIGTLVNYGETPPIIAGFNGNVNNIFSKISGVTVKLPANSYVTVFVGWDLSKAKGEEGRHLFGWAWNFPLK